MNQQQSWQTIALDLKRAGNYLATNSKLKADYYLAEAKSVYLSQIKDIPKKLKTIQPFIDKAINNPNLTGNTPEDYLLAGSLISLRVNN